MVRSIVGTMLNIGRGKLSANDLRTIIEAKNRCKAGMSVAPQGLTLAEITYPDHIFNSPFEGLKDVNSPPIPLLWRGRGGEGQGDVSYCYQ